MEGLRGRGVLIDRHEPGIALGQISSRFGDLGLGLIGSRQPGCWLGGAGVGGGEGVERLALTLEPGGLGWGWEGPGLGWGPLAGTWTS